MSDTGRRDIELRIRAQDLSTAAFQQVAKSVQDLTAAVNAQVAAAQKGAISNGELVNSMTRLKQAGDNLINIQGVIDQFKNLNGVIENSQRNVEAAAAKLTQYRAAIESGSVSGRTAERALAGLVAQLERAEATLQRNKDAQDKLGLSLAKAGIDVKDLDAAEKRLKETADLIGPAITKLGEAHLNYSKYVRLAKEESAKAREESQKRTRQLKEEKAEQDKMAESIKKFNEETKKLVATQRERDRESARIRDQEARDRATLAVRGTTTGSPLGASAQARGLFGLRPYEIQNLSYQVNDIISGLASGQRATQVLAQQGGQVLQLFARNLFALVAFFPQIAVGITAATVAVGTLRRAFQELNEERSLQGYITASVTGINYQASSLVKAEQLVKRFGVSWDDAGKLIRLAIDNGLRQDKLVQFIKLAQDIADVTGKKVTDAFGDLVKGINSGYEGISKLIVSYGGLEKEQLDHIKNLFDENRAIEAQNFALDILTKRYDIAAKQAINPFTQASRDLKNAWDSLLRSLAESGAIKLATDTIGGLARAIHDLVEYLKANPDIGKAIGIIASAVTGAAAGGALFGRAGAVGGAVAGVATGVALSGSTPSGTSGFTGEVPFSAKGLRIDTDELRLLVRTLVEASTKAGLPAGYRVEAISTERPGAIVKATGGPSEHGRGKAIDVQIVDANGNPVPGSMGTDVTGLYTRLDKAFEAAIVRNAPGTPYAIGTRFGTPDAGHFSIRGGEAARQTAREGRITTGTPAQIEAAKALADADAERLITLQNMNLEADRQLALTKLTREAQAANPNDAALQAEHVRIGMLEYERNLQKETLAFTEQVNRSRITDGRNANEIEAAGFAAADKARKEAVGGLITRQEYTAAFFRGEEEARARIQRAEQADESVRQTANTIRQTQRTLDLKYASDLTRSLDAVNQKYEVLISNLEKQIKLYPERQKLLEQQKQELANLKELEIAQTRIDSARAQGRESLQTRNILIQTYNELAEKGEISIEEKERKIKEAYDLTRGSILGAADALQKLIDTDKSLTPEKVALYTAEIAKLRAEVKYVDPFIKGLRDTIAGSFATGVTTAFNSISEAIGNAIAKTAEWREVFVSVRNAALNLFAQLLKDIANYIIKAEAAKIASKFFGSSGDDDSGIGGGIFSAIGKLFGFGGSSGGGEFIGGGDYGGGGDLVGALSFHGGGIVGRDGVATLDKGRWFANAPRYHSGTPVGLGLAPDERRAIFQTGEEVLARDNPRNILNRKSADFSPEIAIRNVLVLDENLIPGAMAGPIGERTTMATIQKNIATIRQLVRP